jgi:DtxR family transcriptional regulator, iron-dependent repressor
MAQATVAEEEYLQTMFWLEEAGLPMTGANIARAMQLSPPTVHEMVGRLVDDGYVERNADKSLAFTESGREHASHIVRRHRMIERFLTDVLGIPWDEVHEEAERIEHAMSDEMEERLIRVLGDPQTCPHGNPMPGVKPAPTRTLESLAPREEAVVERIPDQFEHEPGFLEYLDSVGIKPKVAVTLVSVDDGTLRVAIDGTERTVRRDCGRKVLVAA